jgi:serine phosphatase RsbU (regulator of sigma subunit)
MEVIVIAALAVGSTMLGYLLYRSRARSSRLTQRFEILDSIARVSDAATALPETLDAISEVLVPDLADFCMIDVISGGRVRRATVRVGPGAPLDAERGIAERQPSIPERMVNDPSGESLEPRFFERMSQGDLRGISHGAEDLEFLRGLGVRSAVTVALRARGRVTGALTVGVAWSGRRYRHGDARFARVLSGRVALALDNAGLFSNLERAVQAREEIAETLQRDLLPPPLPHIPGWSAAAMYRPAGAENEVGGDFYDAFPFAGGWMLVIGDVTGRGAQAASITAQARYTLRTAAALTGDPLAALNALNRALLAQHRSAMCSIVAFALGEDPRQPVRLAVAGHPPPVLVDGQTVTEIAAPGPLLGAFDDARWSLAQTLVEPGQQIVVVTDGITEACGQDGRFGEERMRAELEGATSPVLAVHRLEGALRDFVDGALDDDAAILAIAPRPAESPSSVGLATSSPQPLGATTGLDGE